MTTIAGIGVSQRKHSYQAGRTAAKQAFTKLGTQRANLILLFTNEHYDQEAVLRGVRSITGDVPLAGCCGGGNLTAKGRRMGSVAVMALHSDEIKFTVDASEIGQQKVQHVAEQIAESLEDRLSAITSAKHTAVLVLSDSADRKLLDIVAGMTNTLGPICPLIGGGASDHAPARQFFNAQTLVKGIVATLFRSTTAIGVGVRHGWAAVGGPLVVTKSEDHFIVKLNGRPAFEVFREIFAAEQPNLSPETFFAFTRTHPIGLPQISGEYLIREVIQVRSDGAIECVGHIPENAVVRFMEGNPDSLLAGAQQAAQDAMAGLGGKPAGAVLIFDCISRLPLLGDKADAEIERVQAVFGTETPLLGMYSYGEIANPVGVNLAAYHNKTIVVCALASH